MGCPFSKNEKSSDQRGDAGLTPGRVQNKAEVLKFGDFVDRVRAGVGGWKV